MKRIAQAVCLVVVLGVAAGALFVSMRGKEAPSDPEAAKTADQVPGKPEALDGPTELARPSPAERTEAGEPSAEDVMMEAVEPLLELNFVVEGSHTASSATALTEGIDELLGGKHSGKDKTQLLRSLRAVDAVIAAQGVPETLPKDKVLSAEALSALEIERAWLKERVFNP